MRKIRYPHRLADAVHRELRTAHINCTNAGGGRDDGPDGTATTAIVANHEFLNRRQASQASALSNNEPGDTVGSVSLVCIPLDHHPIIHLRHMTFLMLACVVRVNCVSLVDAQNKTLGQCRRIEVGIGLAGVEGAGYALHGLSHDGTAGTGNTGAANLLVIEQCNKRYVFILLETRSIHMINKAAQGEETTGKIIKPCRVDEF
mmetsp:Transcript_5132/g.14543  ORF Transcript_5132/g.14543 Transcript_5132/m.14543 type:complete len:203 (-) Transcript_5132:1034-1642(-)